KIGGHQHLAEPDVIVRANRNTVDRDMRQWQGREFDAFYRHWLFEPSRDFFFDPWNVIVERYEKRQCHRNHKQHGKRDQYAFKPFHIKYCYLPLTLFLTNATPHCAAL